VTCAAAHYYLHHWFGALLGAAPIVNSSTSTWRRTLGGLTLYSGSGLAFGTTVTIKVLHDDAQAADSAISMRLQQVRLVDALMRPASRAQPDFSAESARQPASADKHVLHVLAFSQQLAKLTAGAFDITVQRYGTCSAAPMRKETCRRQSKSPQPSPLVDWSPVGRESAAGAAARRGHGHYLEWRGARLRSRSGNRCVARPGRKACAASTPANSGRWDARAATALGLGIGNPRQHEADLGGGQHGWRKGCHFRRLRNVFQPDYPIIIFSTRPPATLLWSWQA